MESLQETYKKHHFERNLRDNVLIPGNISILFALEMWRK